MKSTSDRRARALANAGEPTEETAPISRARMIRRSAGCIGSELTDVEAVLDQIVGLRDQPAGRVRLLVTPLSATMVLGPQVSSFGQRFPDVVLEIATTQEGRTELVAAGFDAGVHLGESIQRDMVAVRVSRDQRLAIVGSPDYFASHPVPSSPHDLLKLCQSARRVSHALPLGIREER